MQKQISYRQEKKTLQYALVSSNDTMPPPKQASAENSIVVRLERTISIFHRCCLEFVQRHIAAAHEGARTMARM